jgi:hypothetical protein
MSPSTDRLTLTVTYHHDWSASMSTLLRAAALTAMLSAALSADLAAQSDARAKPANPACPLITDQELDAATGMNYGPGEGYNGLGAGIFGGATCLWGGVWNEDVAKSLPQVGVVFIPPGSRGRHTDFYRARKPEAGCTRETLRGVGDFAFAESCQSSSPSMRIYVKAGRNDVFLVVDMLFQHPLSWARPVAEALAKAAALKAKKV